MAYVKYVNSVAWENVSVFIEFRFPPLSVIGDFPFATATQRQWRCPRGPASSALSNWDRQHQLSSLSAIDNSDLVFL